MKSSADEASIIVSPKHQTPFGATVLASSSTSKARHTRDLTRGNYIGLNVVRKKNVRPLAKGVQVSPVYQAMRSAHGRGRVPGQTTRARSSADMQSYTARSLRKRHGKKRIA